MGFDFGVMKTFGKRIKVVAVQHVRVLNATEFVHFNLVSVM